MAGTAVYLSEESGPAVVGFLRPHIVVPRWLTKFSPGELELVIAHERSHLDAHDAQLLVIAQCLLVCMPWNLALWWQLRRLRLAIEIDCDARVLSHGYPFARYGETLIAVGERQSASNAMVMARFGSKSFLEQRISNMLRKKTRHAWVWAMALACLGGGLAVCAAEVAPPQGDFAGKTVYQETAVDSQLLDGYVGSYQYGNAVLLVTRDGQQLAARPAGQSGYPIYPWSNTEFFFKRFDAQISFTTDTQGMAVSLIMHRSGGDVKMKRIDAITAQQLASTTAEKQRTQSSNPGRVAVLSRLVDGIVTGKPNYDDMRSWLATAVNHQLSRLQSVIAPLGGRFSRSNIWVLIIMARMSTRSSRNMACRIGELRWMPPDWFPGQWSHRDYIACLWTKMRRSPGWSSREAAKKRAVIGGRPVFRRNVWHGPAWT